MKIIVWKEDLLQIEGLSERVIHWVNLGFLEILRETKNFFEVGSTVIDVQGKEMVEPEYWINHLYK